MNPIEDFQLQSGNSYLSNPNLNKANVAVEFTQDQIKEFIHCKNDPVYFANQLLYLWYLQHF